MSGPHVRTSLQEGSSLLCLTLNRPKGNVLNIAMIGALREEIAACPEQVRSILLTGDGPNFSFGASVEEHRPDQVAKMLPAFHGLFRDLLDSGRVLLAAVRGNCLGGGLELAAFCHRVFAAPSARLGQPEVKLGVFAPVASVVLPLRLGQARADDLLLTGRTVDAGEALNLGLVDAIADPPSYAARAWHREHIQRLSAAALPCALRAARLSYRRAILQDLDELERLYLEELMSTADAAEGISAFLEKREPQWTHR